MKCLSLSDIQRDWKLLDDPNFEPPAEVRLISHEEFTSCPELDVTCIPAGFLARLLGLLSRHLFHLAYAHQLLRACPRNATLIVTGASPLALFVGLTNRYLFARKRHILCWDIFVETESRWKKALLRVAMRGITLSVLWSRPQVAAHAWFLDMSEDRFVFLPFKANHSKGPRYDLPIGNFVFAGGNGKRDYDCLIDAVRGTGIPVVISATHSGIRNRIGRLPNVILLAASEPGFAQLQAASRFVVIPMVYTGLKGGGEANFCNAMWHGKPLIAADSIAASDYVVEGETGHVVPSGDSEMLRKRIVELWNDPDEVSRMGSTARRYVERNFTHVHFIRRLLRLALLVGAPDSRIELRDSEERATVQNAAETAETAAVIAGSMVECESTSDYALPTETPVPPPAH